MFCLILSCINDREKSLYAALYRQSQKHGMLAATNQWEELKRQQHVIDAWLLGVKIFAQSFFCSCCAGLSTLCHPGDPKTLICHSMYSETNEQRSLKSAVLPARRNLTGVGTVMLSLGKTWRPSGDGSWLLAGLKSACLVRWSLRGPQHARGCVRLHCWAIWPAFCAFYRFKANL